MSDKSKPVFSVITGASSGIGLELARIAANNGSDLLIAAEDAGIEAAALDLRAIGVQVDFIQADLSTPEGVDALYQRARQDGRPIDALFANAGRGLGHGFLDQDFDDIERVIATNVTGTTYLLHRFVRDMREINSGRVLLTGSIAGLMPGSYQAVYNATKAYVDSFAYALRNELQDTEVVVTVLMPGPTDTEFFETADMLDTKVGTAKKADPADVAQAGYDALMRGDAHEVAGWANKVQAMMTRFLPEKQLAQIHKSMAEPGTGKQHQEARMAHEQAQDDAPKRARKDDKDGNLAIVGKSITINRSRAELFAYWRDFSNLPTFMHAIERIEPIGDERSLWTVKAPAGQHVTLETELTAVVDNETIGWRSVEQSQIRTAGLVTFADAPADRGTIVTAEIAYEPPGGDVGRLMAKLLGAEPNIQARHELKRFKMLMETGEIATGANHKPNDGEH